MFHILILVDSWILYSLYCFWRITEEKRPFCDREFTNTLFFCACVSLLRQLNQPPEVNPNFRRRSRREKAEDAPSPSRYDQSATVPYISRNASVSIAGRIAACGSQTASLAGGNLSLLCTRLVVNTNLLPDMKGRYGRAHWWWREWRVGQMSGGNSTIKDLLPPHLAVFLCYFYSILIIYFSSTRHSFE